MQNKTRDVQLQKAFKKMNAFMLLHWRLGLGWLVNIWPEGFGQIMVLTHTGRKSGLKRRTPVNYAFVDGELYCCAGFGSTSDWYRNIKADPAIEVWLPDGSWYEGVVEEVTGASNHLEIMRAVIIASGFAARMFGIDHRKLSDMELDQLTSTYRLLHIKRGLARTGPGGPGDLAWVWPVAVLFMLPLLTRRRCRR